VTDSHLAASFRPKTSIVVPRGITAMGGLAVLGSGRRFNEVMVLAVVTASEEMVAVTAGPLA